MSIPATSSAPKILSKIVRWAIILFVVLPVLGLGLWTWGALHFTFSSGERVGYVQKLSNKGWLFKTWEGELAMANLPGAMPQVFEFSVKNEAVAKKIQETQGGRVALAYEQHRGIPMNWFGETQYFVVNVRPAAEAFPPDAGSSSPIN